ncbi:FAD-binding oxidoreductase [Hyalangium versicolor]|uniref:FAD-binding oxidoreductase n=1 Tax=Hyalangium versicolor TaxID=2861190 RepID=UPI001CCEBE11|nr:FAD-binding protein [Hyalangium versicolor]
MKPIPVTIWNGAATHQPARVIPCSTVENVRDAIRRARADGLLLSVLGGGHDWAGRAIRPGGLVVDLRAMRDVQVEGDTAIVSGGATAADLIAAAAPTGQVAATGTVGAVGMTGMTLGGGYGPLCGAAGLSLDNLLGAEIVLADGRVVTTDAQHEPELFWALRGGGGNFGVVTSMRLRLHPFTTVLAGSVLFPFGQARDVLGRYAELARTAPDALTMHLGVVSIPDNPPVVFVNPTWCGDDDEGLHWVARIEALGAPIMSRVERVPYAEPLRRNDQLFAADGRRYFIRTRNLSALTRDAVSALVTAGEARTSPLSTISIHHFHGTATRVAISDTAFGYRGEHFMVELIASWPTGDGTEHRRWADEAAELLRPHALPGGYPNLLGPEHSDQIADAYGPNTGRLLAAKAAYDPDGVFTATPLPPKHA